MVGQMPYLPHRLRWPCSVGNILTRKLVKKCGARASMGEYPLQEILAVKKCVVGQKKHEYCKGYTSVGLSKKFSSREMVVS